MKHVENCSTWQKSSPQAPPVVPVTNIRYAPRPPSLTYTPSPRLSVYCTQLLRRLLYTCERGGGGGTFCDMSSIQIECHKMKYPFQYMWRVYRWRDTRWEFWNCFTHGQRAFLRYISNFGGQMTSQCQEEKHKWGCSEKPHFPFFAPYVQAQ